MQLVGWLTQCNRRLPSALPWSIANLCAHHDNCLPICNVYATFINQCACVFMCARIQGAGELYEAMCVFVCAKAAAAGRAAFAHTHAHKWFQAAATWYIQGQVLPGLRS